LDKDERTLTAALSAAKTRFIVAVVLAVLTAALGVVGLLAPGTSVIYGLLAILASAILLSYAIRQRAWRDEYGRQLAELNDPDGGSQPDAVEPSA
jgi:hypothetical protein